jgi:hypothetical protein
MAAEQAKQNTMRLKNELDKELLILKDNLTKSTIPVQTAANIDEMAAGAEMGVGFGGY